MENGKELITYAPELPSSKDSMAVSFVKMVKINLAEAQKSFFEIGFRLHEAQRNEYYKELGFENLVDCAKFHFGFKKTMVYDLINVFIAFADKNQTKSILPEFKDFSQSQLIEMSKAKSPVKNFYSMCKPSDTVAKIKKARSIYNDNNNAYEFYKCKTLDDLFKACEAKKAVNHLETIIIESKEKQDQDVKDSCQDASTQKEEPVKVEYQSIGIELKSDAPKEEKTEISENLMPYEDFKKELIKKLRLRSEASVWLIEDKLSHVKLHKISKNFLKDYFNVIKDNSKDIKKFITTQFEKYNYEINLNGRKQPLNVFISNIVNSFIEIFEPPKEK